MNAVVYRRLALGALAIAIIAACAPSAPASTQRPSAPQSASREPGRLKVLNYALTTIIDGFSIAASSTTAGGGLSYIEIHSAPLVTSEKTSSKPIGRLAVQAPSLENGGLVLLPDGRMTATYQLRRDATWHDGTPVTSRDLLLTYMLAKNPSLPIIDSGPTKLMESAETRDDHTFVMTFRQPYYLADSLGLRAFWPLPAHILQADYERLDPAAFLNLPYWTTDYVHAGPFKLAQFVPGTELVFDAYDRYFLGRPKVDRIVVKQFADDNAAYASIMAGAIDLSTEGVLSAERAFELKELWERTDGGSVYIGTGNIGFVSVQFDSTLADYQPALQDKQVRHALYTGVDRAAYADVAIRGHPERGADAILPNDDPLYSYVKGGMDRFSYDPNRASALLQEAGWRRGADGVLVNAAGAPFTVLVQPAPGRARPGPEGDPGPHRRGVALHGAERWHFITVRAQGRHRLQG
jgi:ABC-type transport system substrate-binding protein